MYNFLYTIGMSTLPHVVPSGEARNHLAEYLRAFREEGQAAKPVVFGSHRRPEGVILSYEMYLRLMDTVDDVAIAQEVNERIAEDTGKRVELEDAMRNLGFDPKEFGLK